MRIKYERDRLAVLTTLKLMLRSSSFNFALNYSVYDSVEVTVTHRRGRERVERWVSKH